MTAPLYTSVEQLQAKIDQYFAEEVYCKPFLDKEGKPCYSKQGKILYDIKPPTVAGLSLYLGFANRASMYDYQNNEKYTHTVKRAVARVEEYAETQLTQGSSTGAIFWLKNHGWRDSQEIRTGEILDVSVPQRMTQEEWEKAQK